MKTVLKIFAFLSGSLLVIVIALASNSVWFNAFSKYIPSPYRYGDLYMLSNMPGFRIKLPSKIESKGNNENKNIALTIIGDSYTEPFDSSFFNCDTYRFIHWDRLPDTIPPLDSTKNNIIIIASTERFIRWRFVKNNLLSFGKKIKITPQSTIKLAAEDNLQYMLTNLDVVLPFKELKTAIYLNYFDKFSTVVAKPDGFGRLYLNETVDPQNSSSSFIKIENAEIVKMTENLNKINTAFATLGFNEIYFSIIPNAASIYKKSELPYNHLVERMQSCPEAKFKYIDVYKALKNEKESTFFINDSHWNSLGKKIWLLKVNTILNKSIYPNRK